MRELVGVRPRFGFDPSTIKRDALLFKRIAVPQDPNLAQEIEILVAEKLGYAHNDNSSHLLDVPDWLYEEEFLSEPRFSFQRELREASEEYEKEFDASGNVKYSAEVELANNPELSQNYHRIMNLPDGQQGAEIRRFYSDKQTTHLMPTIHQIIQKLEVSSEHLARAMSIQLRQQDGLNALPVLNREMTAPQGSKAIEQDVIQIVLNEFPVPDDSVPWEQIREFRRDPELQEQFLALRRWMDVIAMGNYVLADVKEEMDYLLNRYRSYLRRRGLKTIGVSLAALLKVTAPFFGKEKGPLVLGFAVALRRLSLWAGEVNVSGSEIAYILTSRDRFSK